MWSNGERGLLVDTLEVLQIGVLVLASNHLAVLFANDIARRLLQVPLPLTTLAMIRQALALRYYGDVTVSSVVLADRSCILMVPRNASEHGEVVLVWEEGSGPDLPTLEELLGAPSR